MGMCQDQERGSLYAGWLGPCFQKCLFICLQEKVGGGAEREGNRGSEMSSLLTAGQTPELRDYELRRNQTLNRLSHLCAPGWLECLIWVAMSRHPVLMYKVYNYFLMFVFPTMV